MPPNTPVDPNKSVTTTLTVTGNQDQVNAMTEAMKHYHVAITDATDKLKYFDDAADQSRGVLNLMGIVADKSSAAMKYFKDTISESFDALNSKADLTTGQMMKLSAAFTGIGAVGDPFKGIARSDSLNTIGDQIGAMIKGLDDNSLLQFVEKAGIKLPAGLDLAGDALKKFVVNMATNADSATHMEDIYTRGAAATGELGSVHVQAGVHLEHMNKIIADQREMMEKAGDATGSTSEQMASYYDKIRLVPGALKEMSEADKSAIGGVDILTATIRLARGTSMEYTDVVNDMHEAVRNYNATIPEAMKFTSQISEISQRYGVELKDVQNELVATSQAMKMFGNESEGAAEIMNHYIGALKSTGLSGAVASDIVGNMTRQIGQLSLAQKAFLSAQSGGPGGLQGAFNIDNMLRQKDGLQKVFEMTKNQMTKMMGGHLVSVKEAAESPQAAGQLTKQIMMLKQGPLGQFARTDQEAERIIEAFKSGKSSDVKDLAKDMSAPLDKGLDYQKQTATGIGQMLRIVQHAAGTSARGALDLFQSGTTAGAGEEFEDQKSEAVEDARNELTRFMKEAGTANTEAPGIGIMNKAANLIGNVGTLATGAVQGPMVAMAAEGAPEAGGIGDPATQRRRMIEGVQTRKDALALAEINNIRDLPGFQGAGLGDTASVVAKRQGQPTGIDHARAAIAHKPTEEHKNMGEITVKVEGYCLDCGEKMRSRSQSYAVAPQTK